MMRASVLIVVFVLISFISCKKDDGINIDMDGPWEKSESGQVILYTRPVNYSSSASPEEEQIQLLLKNQNDFIGLINQELGLHFTAQVSIYLYNYDEALAKIGTNSGGLAITDRLQICYAYKGVLMYYPNRKVSDYIGIHELVHIVSFSQLGKASTRLIGEGYACAVDGAYAAYFDSDGQCIRKLNTKWMEYYRQANRVCRPSELLEKPDSFSEEVFYPQSGYFISWLFNKYGVDKVNQLFTVKVEKFKSEFQRVMGISFAEMETAYLNELK